METLGCVFIDNDNTTKCSCFYHTIKFKMRKVYSCMWWNMCLVSFASWQLILQLVSSGLTKREEKSVTVGAQLLWGARYGCNNGGYGCTIVMSYIDMNKAVSQWLLTFNLCVSVTWTLICAFHIPCTHTPEIIDMHRGLCDNVPGSSFRITDSTWCQRTPLCHI